MRILRIAFIAAGIGTAPAIAFPQPAMDAAAKKAETAPANLASGAITGTPSVQLILDASKKDKRGIMSIGWRSGQDQTQLTLSGPLDDDERAEPISLLGLPNGASAAISYTRRFWSGPTPQEQGEILDLCQRAGLAIDATDPTLTCDLHNFRSPLHQAKFRTLQHLDDRLWVIGGSAGGSRVNHTFVETVTSGSASEARTSWNVSGLAGVFTPALGFTFASMTYKEVFAAAGSASQICRPVPDTDATRCQSVIVGRPSYKALAVVALETRKFIAEKAAIAPTLQFDLRNDVRAIEVPIYFLGSGASPIGGVRFGWRSDTREVTAVMFIGAAFSLLPG